MIIEDIEKCPYCDKKYRVEKIYQTPGFRDYEDERCPYCNALIKKSMTYEFTTYKI